MINMFCKENSAIHRLTSKPWTRTYKITDQSYSVVRTPHLYPRDEFTVSHHSIPLSHP